MPLRKMRSRSLAVVELVLSLSVSRAWCMAAKHTQKKENAFFYSTQGKNSEGKTAILQFYSISRLWRTEMGAASQPTISALSVSFISGCIFLLPIPTFSLLDVTCRGLKCNEDPASTKQKGGDGFGFCCRLQWATSAENGHSFKCNMLRQ